MTMRTKNDIFERYLREYLSALRARKGEILDHVTDVTGMHRKVAIRRFRHLQCRDPAHVEGRGRPLYYTPDVTAALKDVWETGSEVCGELLQPIIGEYVDILLRDRMWHHSDEATGKLRAMSEMTVKRRVGGFMKMRRGRGIFATKPSHLREMIPVFTGPWEGKPPGWGQVDTVVHCGASLLGDMAYTVNYVDVATLWIIPTAQWNKGERATRESLARIKEELPFALRGLHPDTGSEFINWFVKDWCDAEGIVLSRSRPAHKNDNAYVEQKNGHVVRRFLGYTRIDERRAIPAMNKLYSVLATYLNHFVPSRKCLRKERVGSKYQRIYARAETAYARVLTHDAVGEMVKEQLRRLHRGLNPLLLKREVDTLRAKVFAIQARHASPPAQDRVW